MPRLSAWMPARPHAVKFAPVVAVLFALALPATAVRADDERDETRGVPTQFNEATLVQLQTAMRHGGLSAEQLTRYYLARIQRLDQGPRGVNSVIELNPDALAMARQADQLRRQGRVLGPLHGIPVLVKDNLDSGDRMQTTAGSLGLVGTPAARDSTVIAKLREGGAVILGKTNLSEWANFRSFNSSSGWSGRGGQTNNPYGLNRNPCGSSSGSGAAASANFAAVTIATETDGSVVCPAAVNGIVGLKPTVGLTSRAGGVPLSSTQDTVGTHTRTVADAAALLSVIQSRTFDGRDPATGGVPLGWKGRTRPANIPTDYTAFLDPRGLVGARLGITRSGVDNSPAPVVAAWEAAVAALRAAGAVVIDLDAAGFRFPARDGELLVLEYDFRRDLKAYLATRTGVPLAGGTLDDAIAFNNANAAREMPFFGQEIFEQTQALAPGADDPQPIFGGLTYNQALEIGRTNGVNGIDKALADFQLEAVVAPTDTPPWVTDLLFGDNFLFASSGIAATPGYPIIQVPAGSVYGLPFGISFLGTAFSEGRLIKLASGFEAATQARAKNLPTFATTAPFNNIDGTTLVPPRRKGDAKPEGKAAENRARRM